MLLPCFLIPGNYLYADSRDASGPGIPLIYNTQYFPPTRKCVTFWYHMHGVGDSILTINIYQKGNAATEVLKIVGQQGRNWKKATVPISTHLDAAKDLFRVCIN